MNIWKAYCTAKYYNYFFCILARKLNNTNKAYELKKQYQTYLTRIRGTILDKDLAKITNPNEFRIKLNDIFENKWTGHFQYNEMPAIYYSYLDFLECIEIIYEEYINDDWRERVKQAQKLLNNQELSKYETDYIINGKLIALMNPYILFSLKRDIQNFNLQSCADICKDYYGDLIPSMTTADYLELIQLIWRPNRNLQGNRRRDRIKITYPSGEEQLLNGFDAVKAIIDYYSFERVLSRKILVRKFPLLIIQSLEPDKNRYKHLDGNRYINYTGNMTDHLKTANRINTDLGRELKIEKVAI